MRTIVSIVALLTIACTKTVTEPAVDPDAQFYDHRGDRVTGPGYDLYCAKDYKVLFDKENNPYCQDPQ